METELPPDPTQSGVQDHSFYYRALRRLRMIDPGLLVTKLGLVCLLVSSLLYIVPIIILQFYHRPLHLAIIAAGLYIFIQFQIYEHFSNVIVAKAWLISIIPVWIATFIGYALHEYTVIKMCVFVVMMSLPIILTKYYKTWGNVVANSMRNAYLNTILIVPVLPDGFHGLVVANVLGTAGAVTAAIVCYFIVPKPMQKFLAIRKSINAIEQGFSELYTSDGFPKDIKGDKALKLSKYYHHCAVVLEGVLMKVPPLPNGLATTYHRCVYDQDHAISVLANSIKRKISVFQQRYYWHEFCETRQKENTVASKLDDYLQKLKNKENLGQEKHECFESKVDYVDTKPVTMVMIADETTKNPFFTKITLDLKTRNFVQGIIGIGLASIAGYMINPIYFYFASLGAYILLVGSSTTADKWHKMKKRVTGTVFGALLGISSYWLIDVAMPNTHKEYSAQHIIMLTVVVIFTALCIAIMRISYTYCVIFLTAMLVQIYAMLDRPLISIMIDRVIETLIGALIGVVIASIIFPVNSKKALNKGLAIFSVNYRRELEAMKKAWIDCEYDPEITQLARQTDAIKDALLNMSNIMVNTPWGRGPRNFMSMTTSRVKTLVEYTNNAVSQTVFAFELMGRTPKLNEEQKQCVAEAFKALDFGAQLLGLEQAQRNKHIWPDYDEILDKLSYTFDEFKVLEGKISVQNQPDNWKIEYFLAKDLSNAITAMNILHSRLLKNN